MQYRKFFVIQENVEMSQGRGVDGAKHAACLAAPARW